MMTNLLLLFMVGILGNARGADIYHHELKQYPRGESCAPVAAELAKRFADASGAEVYWAGSTKESATTCDIKISYIAEEEIELTNTLDRLDLGASRRGTKRSLEECTADLERERTLFQSATGLNAWISYCYQENTLLNEFPFVPVVEAFGTPELRFFSSDSIFGVTPNVGWGKMLSSLWKTGTELGLPIASLNARPYISASDKEVTIRYFAKERLYLRADGIAEHKSPEICEEQVEEVRLGLASADRPPMEVYCGKYAHEKYQLGIVTLSTNILGIADLRPIEDSKQFADLHGCRAALPDTLIFYRTKLGKNILAGLCSNGEGFFRMTLIEERKPAPKN